MPPLTWTPGIIDKPESCKGCPLYQNGKGFVPDEIQPETDLFILMQNPGKDEVEVGCPAVGKTGQWMDKSFIPLTGLTRGKGVSVGNVIKCRYDSTNDLPSSDVLSTAITHCTSRHLRLPRETRLVIAQGKVAFEYATKYANRPLYDHGGKPATISSWRGFTVSELSYTVSPLDLGKATIPTLFTLHIADLYRDSKMCWVSELDWRKAGDILRGSIQNAHPSWYVSREGQDTSGDKKQQDKEEESFFSEAATGEYITCDTEYIPRAAPNAGRLTILGLYTPRRDGRVLQYDIPKQGTAISVQLRDKLRKCFRAKTIVFHNAIADLAILEENLGITYDDFYHIEDTMLAHAILWSELPHDLEFLSSIYGKFGKFKHLRVSDELLYNYGDVVDTAAVWEAMLKGFKADPQAEQVYREQSLKLIPVLLRARKQGIRVNKERVIQLWNEYLPTIRKVNRLASISCGYPVNINSGADIKSYLYKEALYPEQINRKTKKTSSNDDAIATLRRTICEPFDPDKEITWDSDTESSYSILGRIRRGADPILECRVLYTQLWHIINNYVLGLTKGVYSETKAKRKKAREAIWKKGSIGTHDIVERIYPNFGIHAQKTGRWSTTDPPLAQLPSELRNIVCPDPGYIWISWDWSAIEPRLLQALTGSSLLRRVFDDKLDLHTWTVCYMFNWEFPPNLVNPHDDPACEAWRLKYKWKGKEEPRRVFAKQGRYEMWYGGQGSNAAQSAAQFGLEPKQLKAALSRLATSDPDYYTWRLRMEETIRKTSLIRTFKGRPRRFLSSGHSKVREGINQPMQGGVSDIFNETIVILTSQFPQLSWMWGMHDSQKWQCSIVEALSLIPSIRQVVERTHNVHGTITKFPCDMEIILAPEHGGKTLKEKEWGQLMALQVA